MKEKMGIKKKKMIVKIIFTIIILTILSIAIYFTCKYVKQKQNHKTTNLIINNGNVTESLKKDIYIKDDVIYLSKEDISNFFDSSIYFDEKYNQIITTSYNKTATLPIDSKKIEINSSKTMIKEPVIKKDETYYLPFSEMGDIYNTKLTYISKTDIAIIESLDREYAIATANKNSKIRQKPKLFSKKVAKVKKGDTYIIANRQDKPVPEGWERVRTEEGILGYVKTKKMGNKNILREKIERKNKSEESISLVWDYYSKYASAPNRNGKNIKGVNVVSPMFFYMEENAEVKENIGKKGEEYIQWAKDNNYKIWPMITNDGMIETTSKIMNDYKLREKLINNIVNLVTRYSLDGINIDFEYMYKKDKDLFSRFLIELRPRLNEIGAVLSVDVTAPDGAENWSMCYDRHVIGKTADYIIFMAYDQYGLSADREGTTAGHNWVEANIKKFLGQEGVESNKIVLGIPFYTRLWKEKDGKIFGKPVAISMKNIDSKIPNGVEKKWLEDLKQYYIEYEKNGYTYKMWIEDEKSIEEKLNLIDKYKLSGAAFWVKDMEKESIWDLVEGKLNIDRNK